MMCTACDSDDETGTWSAYRFDLASRQFATEPYYNLKIEDVTRKLKHEDAKFKPSAAAIHPLEHRLYILASAGQLLVITDLRGDVEEVYHLNPDHHPQAEGIAFAPNGALYISNEGKFGAATLKMYQYKHALQRQTQTKK